MSSSSSLKKQVDDNTQTSGALNPNSNSNQNLLPGHFGDFGKKEYWDRFFESRQSRNQDMTSSAEKQKEEDSTFEWYGNYEVM